MSKKLVLMTAVILVLLVSLIGSATASASPPERVKVLISFDRQPGSDEAAIVRAAGLYTQGYAIHTGKAGGEVFYLNPVYVLHFSVLPT